MALDPSISLAYRPPQVNVDVPSPIQQFGQVLSLRNMMQQGQAGQLELQTKMLQLQQIQQAVQERKNLANLFQNPQTTSPAAPPPAAATPVQTPAPETPQYTPVAPYTPIAPPAATPSAPAAVAPAAGPALGAAAVADPFANLPSYSDILRVAPTTGAGHIETISKARKAYWENIGEQHKAQLANINDLATIASTVHDEPTKIAAIAEAFQRKLITPEVRDRLTNHPFNKQEWDGFNTQALDAAKRGEEARAQINQKITEEKDAFDKSMRPYQLTEAQAKATEAGAKAKTATYGSVAQDAALPKNQDQWDTFLAGVPDPILRSKLPTTYSPAAQQQTVSILGQTPNERVTSAETAQQHRLQNVFEAVKTKIDQQKNAREENIYQQTYGEGANQALVGVEPKLRSQVSREVSKLNDEYLKAQAAADQMQSVIEMARSGNKAAGSNLPIIGVETMNALNGIRRMPRYQVEQYGNAGDLLDKIQGKIGGLTQGQPIPADVLQDIESMHNLLRKNSESEYRSKLQSKNDIYHSNFQPVGRTGAVTAEVQRALSNQGPGIHQLGDGSVWLKNADGSIQPTTAPKQ